jgi:glyoxylase-like metal-dependent hydrolase (beta-lactamase superfamily II)
MDAHTAQTIEFKKNLFLIPLDLPLRGFRDFVGVWLYRGAKSFLVDVGPSATASRLIRTLKGLGVRRLDQIFLTHIHLDHAGGIGELAAQYPDTPVFCHASAMPHLIDPARLWQGTRRLLGPVADAYGPIRPVEAGRLRDAARLDGSVRPIFTPGHAPHHISYRTEACLFVGEAGGVCLPIEGPACYLRPATPPKLFFDQALESLDRLLDSDPREMCYGHFGMVANGREMLERHRGQLLLWREVTAPFSGGPGEARPGAVLEALMRRDPLLRPFAGLPAEIQHREAGFLENSVRGFLEYHAAGR